ncbi:hypothetical protein [uncultured Chitinophaga sp.]|jgi:hypothetical protein|nr:hypothetical protein [uncultured Chitinophaga sp.]
MKKKTSQKLQLTKIKISKLNKSNQPVLGNRTLPTTQFISCGPTYWVC